MYCTSLDETVNLEPEKIQRDGELRRLFLSSAGQDEHLQETEGKIGQSSEVFSKTRCAARKAKSTEATRDDPQADRRPPAKQAAFHRRDASHDPENCQLPAPRTQVLNLLAFSSLTVVGKNYLQESFCSHAHFSSPSLQSPSPAVRLPSYAGCETTPSERSPASTGNNLCVVVCCTKNKKNLKKHPATAYGNMPQVEEDHVLVSHMPQVPLPPCQQHMLE